MAYTYYRAITIDESLCGSADSTNFPVLFAGTYSYLATVANGGKVQNANGYDIGFFADSALTTPLDWEVVEYTATTGKIEAHVRVPTLSASANTVIYIAYGDSGISTFQGDVAGTWNSGFALVAHLPDGTTLSANDSTSNANHGTVTNAVAAAGKIGGGASFDGAGDSIDFGSGASVDTLSTITIEAWLKRGSVATTTDQHIASKEWNDGSGFGGWWFYIRRDSDGSNGGKLKFGRGWSTATYESALWRATTKLNSTAVWYHCVVTYDAGSTSNNPIIYLNGVSETLVEEQAPSGTLKSDNPYNVRIGEGSYGENDLNGVQDEFRVSNVIRSADWVLATYNNQNDPSTFYALGSEVGGAASATASGGFTVAGSATAQVGVSASASGSIAITGSASAIVGVNAVASGSISIMGSATAVVGVSAVASGSIAITGSATAQVGVDAVASGSISITGSATAEVGVTAAASGSIAITGSATAEVGVTAVASGSIAITGSASAIVGNPPVDAAASGSIAITGSATAQVGVSASASGSIAITGSATAQVGVTAAASGSISITGSASAIVGNPPVDASASGSIAITGSATAQVGVTAAASGSIAITGSATAQVGVTAAASGSIAITGSATAVVGNPPVDAAASGSIAITGSASAQVGVSAAAAGSIAITGSASAQVGVTAAASGVILISGSALANVAVIGYAAGSLMIGGSATATVSWYAPPASLKRVDIIDGSGVATVIADRSSVSRVILDESRSYHFIDE